MASLTERECQVLELLAQARRDREIAEILGISIHTAKNHVHNILAKLNADNRNRAVALWLQHGQETGQP